MMDFIVGTAGHIDHGKTALVKALTGVDADRFPEEKLRGITIDIGFAELDFGNTKIGFVDVPGHEKFVKNMLAGASGIDAVMLVIAADEGVMPQTREHFEICRLLETKAGLIVLTKKDLADAEILEILSIEAAELVENSFLENAPILSVSAKTGEGIEKLKTALKEISAKIPRRKNDLVARLPIDRSFTVKGFGAVVTGTLHSGEITETQELEVLPLRRKVRVRGLQVYGKAVKAAIAGQRTAVNLSGIDHTEIERGMVLSEIGILRPTQIFDAEIEILKDATRSLKSRQRIRVHIGTLEVLARIQVLNTAGEIARGEKDFAQIRLENPIVCVPNERFIIRSYSPQMTIAGGRVLDNSAKKHRRKNTENVRKYLENLIEADSTKQIELYLETSDEKVATFEDLQARTALREEALKTAIRENIENETIIQAEKFLIAGAPFEDLKKKTLLEIENFHRQEPLAKGIGRETLREKIFSHLPHVIFRAVLDNLSKEEKIASEKDFVCLASHNLELSADEKIIYARIEKIYKSAKLEVPKLEEALTQAVENTKVSSNQARKVFQLFLNSGEIIKISDEFYFMRSEIENLVEKLKNFATNSSDRLIDVPVFKSLAGISRKYAIPLLEYFDRQKITRRDGDKRLVL